MDSVVLEELYISSVAQLLEITKNGLHKDTDFKKAKLLQANARMYTEERNLRNKEIRTLAGVFTRITGGDSELYKQYIKSNIPAIKEVC